MKKYILTNRTHLTNDVANCFLNKNHLIQHIKGLFLTKIINKKAYDDSYSYIFNGENAIKCGYCNTEIKEKFCPTCGRTLNFFKDIFERIEKGSHIEIIISDYREKEENED